MACRAAESRYTSSRAAQPGRHWAGHKPPGLTVAAESDGEVSCRLHSADTAQGAVSQKLPEAPPKEAPQSARSAPLLEDVPMARQSSCQSASTTFRPSSLSRGAPRQSRNLSALYRISRVVDYPVSAATAQPRCSTFSLDVRQATFWLLHGFCADGCATHLSRHAMEGGTKSSFLLFWAGSDNIAGLSIYRPAG